MSGQVGSRTSIALSLAVDQAVGLFEGPWHVIRYQSPALVEDVGGDFRGCPAHEVLVDPALRVVLEAMGRVFDAQAPARVRVPGRGEIRVLPRIRSGVLLGVATAWPRRTPADAATAASGVRRKPALTKP
jgi:hypothetical protein